MTHGLSARTAPHSHPHTHCTEHRALTLSRLYCARSIGFGGRTPSGPQGEDRVARRTVPRRRTPPPRPTPHRTPGPAPASRSAAARESYAQ
ncbi:hypothetical protein RR46_12029 [Papilio xuthus]|uniref:Uncharacterized protein n=1 Tax=Papilio xuthus TaxID=66420 RepID=A0A194PV68_PAPXU|nr:hypothetical protein RR46_12029 [Papilio xuthus]